MPVYKIYSIHESYSASSAIFGCVDYFTHDVAAVARFMRRTLLRFWKRMQHASFMRRS
jgi:hypothetical protein